MTITELLKQMHCNAKEIEKRLIEAPLSLTGLETPTLFRVNSHVQNLLCVAEKIWDEDGKQMDEAALKKLLDVVCPEMPRIIKVPPTPIDDPYMLYLEEVYKAYEEMGDPEERKGIRLHGAPPL